MGNEYTYIFIEVANVYGKYACSHPVPFDISLFADVVECVRPEVVLCS